uniref:Uncharacterized protein n=1 Tax=Heterorhabditis bacteriophora TaxID=37862 RepID=A0A1I7X5F1_HETBA
MGYPKRVNSENNGLNDEELIECSTLTSELSQLETSNPDPENASAINLKRH